MAIDTIELVMRTEEEFEIPLDEFHASQIRTVGDLYQTICRLRAIPPVPNPDTLTISDPPRVPHPYA